MIPEVHRMHSRGDLSSTENNHAILFVGEMNNTNKIKLFTKYDVCCRVFRPSPNYTPESFAGTFCRPRDSLVPCTYCKSLWIRASAK